MKIYLDSILEDPSVWCFILSIKVNASHFESIQSCKAILRSGHLVNCLTVSRLAHVWTGNDRVLENFSPPILKFFINLSSIVLRENFLCYNGHRNNVFLLWFYHSNRDKMICAVPCSHDIQDISLIHVCMCVLYSFRKNKLTISIII